MHNAIFTYSSDSRKVSIMDIVGWQGHVNPVHMWNIGGLIIVFLIWCGWNNAGAPSQGRMLASRSLRRARRNISEIVFHGMTDHCGPTCACTMDLDSAAAYLAEASLLVSDSIMIGSDQIVDHYLVSTRLTNAKFRADWAAYRDYLDWINSQSDIRFRLASQNCY
jgi:hypothetical protein